MVWTLQDHSFRREEFILLENLDGKILDAPINECYLKHFMQ
jgi:hypothetical protein